MTTTAPRVREFKMPDVGEGLTEAEILNWYVRPGDTVTDGQPVCEVETAKAAVELPIPFDGVVRELRFQEGETVAVGTVIITVDTKPGKADDAGKTSADDAGEADDAGKTSADGPDTGSGDASADDASADGTSAEAADPGSQGEGRQPVLVGYGVASSATRRRPRKPQSARPADPAAPPQSGVPAQPAHPTTSPAAPPDRNGAPPTGDTPPASDARPLAKPPVRKLAKDLGVDLTTVPPTGPNGVITREDVQNAAAAASSRAEEPAAPARSESATSDLVHTPAVEPQPVSALREHRVPVRGVRKATAEAMVASAFTAPHVTEFVTVDVTRTMKLVEKLKQDPDMAGLRVNPLLMVARAFLVAIRRNPEINASWDEERQEIVQKDYINLGIAAATPRGLIVPNIKDAGAMTLPELSAALAELVTTAREGRTTPQDMRGGTVTITNVGVFGVDTGTPILNPGESAILAFGQIRLQPWVHKGKVKPRQVTTLALSFDHRLVDGELGSKVLADTAAVLEHPKRLITWTT